VTLSLLFFCTDYCNVCRTACGYLALSENLKPQERIFFRSLKDSALKYFEQIAQVWSFRKQQYELQIGFFKQHLLKSQNALQEAICKIDNQEKELKAVKKENAELKSVVGILKGSLSRSQSSSRSCTPRPIAITSPSQTVTPRHSSQLSSQVVSRASPMDSVSHLVTPSGGFNQSTPSYGVSERRTPVTSNQDSPISAELVNCRPPSQSSSTLNFPFLGEQSNMSRYQMQSSTDKNPSRLYSGNISITPIHNADRLRSLKLTLAQKTPCNYHSRA
uniref:Ring finger protein 212B n=1 Tax=Leptobrachium leishanense TaxID=445787 RepID=A0A8C5PJZ5_9ANUR